MKTFIIQLEQHDDVISIRDKMSWAKSPRILLVVPPHKKINVRPLDMVLLKRHAALLGAQLGLSSRSGEIRKSAMEAGIPAFKTTSEAQSGIWTIRGKSVHAKERRRRRKNPADLRRLQAGFLETEPGWLKKSSTRIWIFFSGVLAVLLILAMAFPSATIEIKPRLLPQSIKLPITADPEASGVNISGIIPAYPIEIEISGSGQTTATGVISVPEIKAAGDVRFSNLTQSAVRIPEGTIIKSTTDPVIRFYVTQAGELSAGVGRSLSLPVKAVVGGDEGNLPADTLQNIEGPLGLSLSVTNPEPTSGGKYIDKASATDDDREKLLSEVEATLSSQALTQINELLPPNAYLVENSIRSEPVSIIFDPNSDLPGPTLSLSIDEQFNAFYIKEDDLNQLGTLVLNSTLPKGFQPVTNSLSVTLEGSPRIDENGKIHWEVMADRTLSALVDHFGVISTTVGRTVRGARQDLVQLENSEISTINISPSWWIFMPSLPMRISVRESQ